MSHRRPTGTSDHTEQTTSFLNESQLIKGVSNREVGWSVCVHLCVRVYKASLHLPRRSSVLENAVQDGHGGVHCGYRCGGLKKNPKPQCV